VITLNVAVVTTPTHRYTKARARLRDDRLRVTNRRDEVLLEVEAPQERVDDKGQHFRYGDVEVVKMSTCGCGGTRIEAL
jgi:hypothetical protein